MSEQRDKPPITVVKCGGNGDVDPEAVCADVAALVAEGRRVVLVHGGSAEIERLADRLGVPQRKQTAPDGVSARHTDERTLEVVTLALAGSVKPKLVRSLVDRGVRAMGMTGLDGRLLLARRKKAQRALVDGRTVMVHDNLSGVVTSVNGPLLHSLLDAGMVPVISPPAITPDGEVVNIDADRTAAAAAAALDADTLMLLTGAPGVQSDPADESSVMETCTVPRSGRPPRWARGGMALKLVAAQEALRGGARRVLVADGRRRDPVRRALAGDATRVVLEAPDPAAGGEPRARRPEEEVAPR
ncbi:acetylglutamate kinase [Streptomyces solincola]|uniref:Acetylglutamate kinase n=1 Tax=Streptomyces solincola TaxID=2100817 RepID=A0A2S9PQI0_9ACTN|nr:[LysW]-aminoadipate kinase [Streptomyces solincola]PRH76653.1 acetylglutamate kinase [Streptomyces solincola]